MNIIQHLKHASTQIVALKLVTKMVLRAAGLGMQ